MSKKAIIIIAIITFLIVISCRIILIVKIDEIARRNISHIYETENEINNDSYWKNE